MEVQNDVIITSFLYQYDVCIMYDVCMTLAVWYDVCVTYNACMTWE